MLIGPRPDAVCSLTGPSENVGTYGPSFGPLCTVTFLAERERAPERKVPAAHRHPARPETQARSMKGKHPGP